MRPLFIDAGYLIALEASDDQHHDAAVRHRRALLKSPPLVRTSYVFDEVVTFFNGRGRHAKGVEVGESLLGSPSVEFIHVDEPLFREGREFFRKHRDKSYSLTDCVSFLTNQ